LKLHILRLVNDEMSNGELLYIIKTYIYICTNLGTGSYSTDDQLVEKLMLVRCARGRL